MGVGTGQHGTLPGLNGAPTLDTWDSGAPTLAGCQPQRGTFVLLVSVTYPERSLSAGSHASLHSTSHCLCAQLARDSPHFLLLDPGYNCMVPVKSKYELERRGLTLALQ